MKGPFNVVTTSENRDPALHMGNYPVWWHPHGTKSKLFYCFAPRGDRYLSFGSDATIVEIKPFLKKYKRGCKVSRIVEGHFQVAWEIRHCMPWGEADKGVRILTANEVKLAFGVLGGTNRATDADRELLQRYGGTVARIGRFIRWKDYLCIPGPGTGKDGDPNVAIFVTEEIQQAVRDLLG